MQTHPNFSIMKFSYIFGVSSIVFFLPLILHIVFHLDFTSSLKSTFNAFFSILLLSLNPLFNRLAFVRLYRDDHYFSFTSLVEIVLPGLFAHISSKRHSGGLNAISGNSHSVG